MRDRESRKEAGKRPGWRQRKCFIREEDEFKRYFQKQNDLSLDVRRIENKVLRIPDDSVFWSLDAWLNGDTKNGEREEGV